MQTLLFSKKVVKKLSGVGKRSAEWFTSIGNEHSQIVSFVLTCEESTEKLEAMCHRIVERFRLESRPECDSGLKKHSNSSRWPLRS